MSVTCIDILVTNICVFRMKERGNVKSGDGNVMVAKTVKTREAKKYNM